MRYPETAQLIKSARRRQGGMTQQALAEALGCSRLQVIRWEHGENRPDPEGYGARLVEVLGIESNALASADEEEEEAAPVRFDAEILDTLMAALQYARENIKAAA